MCIILIYGSANGANLGGRCAGCDVRNSSSIERTRRTQEFKAKMRWLYDAIGETMDASVSYLWVTYWFTGMTSDDVYKDVWICSASPIDVIRAAKDYFQIPGVTDIVAMTNKKDSEGRYINQYDYDLTLRKTT